MKQKNLENVGKQMELLQDIMLAEMVEFVVPLVYLFCFITAYYGPNAEIIGNIKNDYFQCQKVEDPVHAIQNMAMFFFIDSGSLILSSFILWTFGRINLYRAFCFYQKEYGVVFVINTTFILFIVSIRNYISNYIMEYLTHTVSYNSKLSKVFENIGHF